MEMEENLGALVTETQNPQYAKLDTFNTLDIIKAMNEEDKKVALAVEKEIPNIAKAIDKIVSAFKKGGRLFYIGAGTSGRLGVLDASECPPTFGVSPDMVQAIMAGGERAYIKALEGAEDDPKLGRDDLLAKNITANDVVVGIAASGRTPYVIGALEAANQKGATTVALTSYGNSHLATDCDYCLLSAPESDSFPVVGMRSRIAQLAIIAALHANLALGDMERFIPQLRNMEREISRTKL